MKSNINLTVKARQWLGLTDEERRLIRKLIPYNQFMTAAEYAEIVQRETENRLKEKNT